MMFNSGGQNRDFVIPAIGATTIWNLFVDTAAKSPHDIYPDVNGPSPLPGEVVKMPCHSLKVFVSKK
jgi:isoamylase